MTMNKPNNTNESETAWSDSTGTSDKYATELAWTLDRPVLRSSILRAKESWIIKKFEDICRSHGLIYQTPVPLNSWVDDTVYFIGAPISVLKPYITASNIPENGLFLSQPCIRSRNLTLLYDDAKSINWWSTFTWICALVKPEQLQHIADVWMRFFVESLQIPKENIIIRVSQEDEDLMDVAHNVIYWPGLEIDTKPAQYYNHQYGMNDIVWRNFNFAIKQADGQSFSDVWNVIIIEDKEKKYGVELALGASTILTQVEGVEHIMDISSISDVIPHTESLYRKLQDCIVSTCLLVNLGERPSGSNNRWRVLRSYMRWILYLASKLQIKDAELQEYFKKYEILQYGAYQHMYDIYNAYKTPYVDGLMKKWPVSEEDKHVCSAIQS